MTLAELGELLRGHGAQSTVVYASRSNLSAFRAIAAQNLKTHGDFLLVNYQRAVLGQKKVGHISPVAAYHAGTNRFLILDVAADAYPPVWVPAADLWEAMNAVDRRSGQSRGFVIVREISAQNAAARRALLRTTPQLGDRDRFGADLTEGG